MGFEDPPSIFLFIKGLKIHVDVAFLGDFILMIS